MKTIKGIIEHNGIEYDYTANLRNRETEARPDEVTDIDLADGSPLGEVDFFEELEELALENARLLDWCERNGYEIEDTGGGCTAFTKLNKNGITQRITAQNGPRCPQTFSEPAIVGLYDPETDLGTGPITILNHGIQMLIPGWSK